MPAALMIGHHLAISDFCNAESKAEGGKSARDYAAAFSLLE